MTLRFLKTTWQMARQLSPAGRAMMASAAVTLALGACGDTQRRPIGSSCGDDTECVSGMCAGNVCIDPEGDEDQDGVLNRIEVAIGSNAFAADTDGDGIPDRDELDASFGAKDGDADGTPDILESAIEDADADCITDQYDGRNLEPDDDLSPMIHVCSTLGVCGHQSGQLRVTCPSSGQALCVYDDIVGYADPEVSCDGIDENCDGQIDEAFVDASGAANCGGPTPYVGSATGGGVVLASERFKAKITVGPAIVGPLSGQNYRVNIGAYPREVGRPAAEGN